jgi:hypothetical protein
MFGFGGWNRQPDTNQVGHAADLRPVLKICCAANLRHLRLNKVRKFSEGMSIISRHVFRGLPRADCWIIGRRSALMWYRHLWREEKASSIQSCEVSHEIVQEIGISILITARCNFVFVQ